MKKLPKQLQPMLLVIIWGGGRAAFPEYLIVAWIYDVNPNKVYADFETAFHIIKLNYYASRA